jgi:hypothetical protein
MFFIGLALAALPAAPSCHPIAGWQDMLAKRKPHFIVIGEIHGNAESPTIFADAVCLTAEVTPVIVALELPASEQDAIDRFLASDGGTDARSQFLQSPMWNSPFKDGRSSVAMVELFERLRILHIAGRVAGVVAITPELREAPASTEAYEAMMALEISRASRNGFTTLVLTGNVHASRTPVVWGEQYLPMAGHLPRPLTVTFDITGNGGETWACSGSPIICGPMDNGHISDRFARGVELSADEGEMFSGVLYLGQPTTISPPAVAAD